MRISPTRWRWLLGASVLAAVDGGLPGTVHAETRTVAALTPEAVWDAIDAAGDGDTVQLPEGTRGDGGVEARVEHRTLGEDEGDHPPGRRHR